MNEQMEVSVRFPSAESVVDAPSLSAYALGLQEALNDLPIAFADKVIAAQQTAEHLDRLCVNLYMGSQVQCRGEYTQPVIGSYGGVIGSSEEEGFFEGQSFGFLFRSESAQIGDSAGAVLERIELGHIIKYLAPSINGKFGRVSHNLWIFAPIDRSQLRTMSDIRQEQVQELLEVLDASDVFLADIDEVLYANNEINLPSLGQIFVSAQNLGIPQGRLDDYLTYVNLLLDWSGTNLTLITNAFLSRNESGEFIPVLGAHEIVGATKGFVLEQAFSANIKGDSIKPLQSQELYLTQEVMSSSGDVSVLLVPVKDIIAYDTIE